MTRAEQGMEDVRLLMATNGVLDVTVWKITGRSAHGDPSDLTRYVLTAGNAVFPDMRDISLLSWKRVDRIERLGAAHLVGTYEERPRDPL